MYPKISKEELKKIGIEEGVTKTHFSLTKARRLNDFVKFIHLRLPNEFSRSYVREWAQRFYKHDEWFKSDLQSRKVLVKINPNWYGTDINRWHPKHMPLVFYGADSETSI